MLQDLSLFLLCYANPIVCDISKQPGFVVFLSVVAGFALTVWLCEWWLSRRQTEQSKGRRTCR